MSILEFLTYFTSVADPDPGSGIGCLFDPWIRDGRKSASGSAFFGLKYLNSLRIRDGDSSDPGWKKVGSGIRDKHPGSATLHFTHNNFRFLLFSVHFNLHYWSRYQDRYGATPTFTLIYSFLLTWRFSVAQIEENITSYTLDFELTGWLTNFLVTGNDERSERRLPNADTVYLIFMI
jgi:hypothetical protein